MKAKTRRELVGLAFVSPWLIGFLLFTAWPFLRSIQLSFTRYDIVRPPKWVGLANYDSLLRHDEVFRTSAIVTLKYALISVPLGIVLGVALALLLNINVRGITIYRTVFFIPSIVPTVASTAIFSWILNPQIGLVNGILGRLGVTGPAWLGDPKWALWSLVFMGLWGVGNSMVIYLAGLKDIPTYLYEAATVDGASPIRKLFKITLPLLSPVIFFNLVMGVIGAMQYFTQAYIMTGGGPEDSTRFYALYLFDRAWRYADMGYASAMAWILFLAIITLTGFLFRSQRRWVHYGG
ncbi:MAG: ABC transporter permease subunit [Armatimonadetes bacterium]|nr:ABC transporter permease subunit [Armatimonadota bacterium]